MDNQIFPGGTYLDDMPQVCSLCGVVMNNARSLYSHMQLHILSSNLGGQPPDAGLALNPASILDLLTGVVPSSVPAPLLPHPTSFTPSSSVPNILLTPNLDLGLASLQSVPVPHPQPPVKPKEKKSSQPKHQSQSSSNKSSTSSRTSGNSGSFIPSFTKESKKHEEPNSSHSKSDRSSKKEQFQLTQKFDPEDPLGLASLGKTSFERQSSAPVKTTHEPSHNKDLKLFQPFVTTETTSSLNFLPKSNPFHTSSGLISPPVSQSPDKNKDIDVLNTPQKVNPLSSDLRKDNISLTTDTDSQKSLSGEGRSTSGRNKSQELFDTLFDKMKETPAPPPKPSSGQSDSHLHKPSLYPSILDPMTISPKSSQLFTRENVKETDPIAKVAQPTPPFSTKLATSFEAESIISSVSQNQTTPIISPKIDTTGTESAANTDTVANSTIFEPRDSIGSAQTAVPPPIFGTTPSTSGIPPVGITPLRSTSPPVLGHTDPTKNPLGTGFFNALTSKLINPGLSICTDFTKTPTTSTVNVGADSSSKAYYENGVLLNHDYDKISDTNDEDDLERLIDIDPKEETNIDSKSIDIIDDILNEFNERTEDANKGSRNHLYDICNVLDDNSKGKSDGKSDLIEESTKANTSIIDELLEKEKEKIDLEMRESARMQASTSVSVSTNVVTCTSSTLTLSSGTSTSTVSSAGLNSGVPLMSSVPDQNADKKKDDDNIDFEIPRVGKLMKIRKYYESQDQKKKEQTQVANKDTAIIVQEKKEPVVEEKPQLQTVLVQVSKRKKIEYGPYINRQSLLEGKPKEAQAASPPKLFRPKPRPQVPVRRTFNLRTRRTKTDFASLANKGSRNADGKKIIDKMKRDASRKNDSEKDPQKSTGDKQKDEIDDKDAEQSTDSKIVTRNKAAKKEIEKPTLLVKSSSDTSKKIKFDKAGILNRPSLRTRSSKDFESEKQENEGKSLRRRMIKPSSEDSKVKGLKSNETSPIKGKDDANSGKLLRSKGKTTPEKNELKQCSVNLGENLSGFKLKALSTVEGKDKKKSQKQDSGNVKASELSESICGGMDEKSDNDKKKVESKNEQTEDNNLSKKDKNSSKKDKNDEIDSIVIDGDKGKTETQADNEDKKKEKSELVGKTYPTQANIFDVMSVDIDESKEKLDEGKDKTKKDNQPEKKVQVIKLKLGSEIQKSLREIKESLSLSKKRSHRNDLQKELETCTKKVSEIQRQIESHKEAESLKRYESSLASHNKIKEDESSDSTSKKVKHSVENEFQRLVDEAVEEVKKAEKADTGKQERYVNLRKRLNESVKYNVDISDEESELLAMMEAGTSTPKSRKLSPKGSKVTPRFIPKFQSLGKFQKSVEIIKPVKKDVDVYDFTDTEMSDKEDTTPIKLSSFKPKYVSNIGQKFPSKSIKVSGFEGESAFESAEKETVNDDHHEISYVGKTVEPLKIKLTKIIPYKEKKHKHKKKKRKKDKERKKFENIDDDNDADDDDDDESRDSMDIDDKDSDSIEGVEEELDSLASHNQGVKKSKLKTKNHICAFCNQAFGQKCDLRKHEMIHTGERPWPCEICDKKFLRKTDLAKHIRTHTGEKPYKCEFCDKRVSDKSQLNVHRRLHTGDRPYRCTQCGRGCITSSELTRHRATHCVETSYKCELCKKVFKMKECLGMHMKLHYKDRGKPYKCEYCALGFNQLMDLDKHKCANSMPDLFICSECYTTFTDELTYSEHIRTHDLDVFSCNVCTHVFEYKHSLETHLCSMGVDLQKQLHCEYCEKVFHDQASLTKHLPDHDDDTGSFMCENCPQIFTVRKDFLAHSQKHHTVNAFICNKCGTGFHDAVRAEMHLQKCVGEKMDIKAASEQSLVEVIPKDDHEQHSKSKKSSGVTRASVISENVNFKNVNSGPHLSIADSFYQPTSTGIDMGLQNAFTKQESQTTVAKIDILDSDKIFEPTEFSNSPDFSSLTDDGNLQLELNAFQKAKSNFSEHESQKFSAGKVTEFDILSQQSINSQKSKQFQGVTSNLQSSHNNAQTDDNRWIGSYQSANDYVNSLLSKMETDASSSSSSISVSGPKRLGLKPENNQFAETLKFQPTNTIELKDNIENQAKTDIFSDFDFSMSNQKVPDLYQTMNKTGMDTKFTAGTSSQDRVEFQDVNVNQSSFMPHTRQGFQDKTDFSSFSNSFLSFPQSSTYSLTGTGSLFGSSGQNTHKQSSANSLFTGNQDLMHNNYFLEVEESIKGTLPTDKSDDTAALLSNFDYDLN